MTWNVFSSAGDLVCAATTFVFNRMGVLKTGTKQYNLVKAMETQTCVEREEWQQTQDAIHDGILPSLEWLDAIANAHFDETRLLGGDETKDDTTRHAGRLTVHFPTSSAPVAVVHASLIEDGDASWPAAPAPDYITPSLDVYHLGKDHNLCEARATLLSKSLLLSGYDAQSSPSPRERKRLNSLVELPTILLEPLKSEDVSLLWKFRLYIVKDHRFFLLFMRQVNWQEESVERKKAESLIADWKPIKLASILGCLSYHFQGVKVIRQYAIAQLAKQPDHLICRCLFFLVQATSYDDPNEMELGDFLIQRALGNWEMCSTLWWCVSVQLQAQMERVKGGLTIENQFNHFIVQIKLKRPDFEQRLITQQRFAKSLREMSLAVTTLHGSRTEKIEIISKRIEKGKESLCSLFTAPRAKATRQLSSSPPEDDALFAPTHPSLCLTQVDPKSFYIYKSANAPLKLCFHSAQASLSQLNKPKARKGSLVGEASEAAVLTGVALPSDLSVPSVVYSPIGAASHERQELSLMFKANDNVRQDQLIVDLIAMMDVLLQKDGLEVGLSPYRVMGTGPNDGLIEVVPSVVTLQSIQGGIADYLRQYNSSPDAYQKALDRYARSLAGYSVISFVLGLGDRHLENILLARDGRLLHIDFGYILGNDPKPFPPPMKITSEMIVLLGEPEGEHHLNFTTYCGGIYNVIRKNADLILNLLTLMVHAADLPQLAAPDDQVDPRINVLKVQERLRVDLNNVQATQYIQQVVSDSVGSVFTNFWDVLHVAAQATRA
ncbi:Phosphoinositide 3-kinase family, accessory domain (PIK domain)/Phosphatidylinositol 3- and 4-kinase, putative [Angomonas deanei]|uniref:phosphatidylinositol 3-kinase n=1 Tax=Angomonas deanei TaxID=59799 RepID=A0A7G2CIR1_9TRYP|nr:Phosphoinositide 3-kinase family, accessory domain (PIK domain)/Phosphatidylinositol 3- and 4-kinase, putative [Angomonas deanei]